MAFANSVGSALKVSFRPAKAQTSFHMFSSIQSGSGFGASTFPMVWPEMQKRHSSGSMRPSPIMILMVFRKENRSLCRSNKDRQTFT